MGGAEEESRLDWNMFGCSAPFYIEFRFVTAAPLREGGRKEGGRGERKKWKSQRNTNMSPHLLSIHFKDHCDNELNICQQHQSDLVSYTHGLTHILLEIKSKVH